MIFFPKLFKLTEVTIDSSSGRGDERRNKAVYTTASVAYGWAGAVTEVRSPFGVFSHCVTDKWTNGWTNRQSDL